MAWDLVKHIYKLKNADKTTFCSSVEARRMPALTAKSPEEQEFVVDSGASMHMLSKKVLSSDELDTLGRSRNSTVVVTANGKVPKNGEALENIHDLDLFVTVQILEETAAVLSLGKLCEEHGKTLEWASSPKPNLTKQGKTFFCKTNNFRTSCCPWIVKFWYKFVLCMATAGLVKYIFKYIFKSSVRAKWRTSSRKLERITPNERRLMQFQSWSSVWKQTRSETRRTIVLSCTKGVGTDWRKETITRFRSQRGKSFWNKRPHFLREKANEPVM